MSGWRVLLPLSDDVVKEIARQVTLRGQGDRVATSDKGKMMVDLHGVALIAEPEQMKKEN